jgi:hypothetical protein
MEQILQEVKNSLKNLVDSNYFSNIAESDKQDFVNRNLKLFEEEFPFFVLSQIPVEVAKNSESLEEYMGSMDFEQLTKNFIDLYKDMVK